MPHVLVTGASGFIGPHLVRSLLEQGDTVTCLVRPASQTERLKELGCALVRGDVLDEQSLHAAVADVEVVYHLAGLTKALRKQDLWRVNEGGLRNLARACAARTSPPVLVSVSSLAAAGPAPGGRPRVEADPPQPVSNYGHSKRAGERAAEGLAGQVPITIVRPPIVFGEGDRDVLEMVRPIVRFGLHLVTGFTVRQFSLLHAADLACALRLAAARGARLPHPKSQSGDLGQGYYFLAADERPTYAELGKLLATAAGRDSVRVVRTPELLTWAVAAATQAVSQIRRRTAILSLDKAREAVAGSWTCDDRRARADLAFHPAAPLLDRLRQTIDWYRSEGWL